MEKSKRFRTSVVSITLLALLLIGGVWIVQSFSAPGPDDRADLFMQHFRNGKWESIFEMSSEKEQGLQSWGKSEFSRLMTDVSRECIGGVLDMEYKGDWSGQETWKMFHFFYHIRDSTGKTVERWIAIPFYRGTKGWHPRVYDLPMQVVNLSKRPSRDSLTRLARLCDRHGVDSFIRMDDKLEFSIARLKVYLEGNAKWNTVMRHSSGG